MFDASLNVGSPVLYRWLGAVLRKRPAVLPELAREVSKNVIDGLFLGSALV